LELWQRIQTNRYTIPYDKWYVYMHEYKITKPIDYTYIPDIDINPRDEPYKEICEKGACVHPQKIFHGHSSVVMEEIGTELTIPYAFPIFEHIKPVHTYKVNIIPLLDMQNKYSHILNETNAWNNILEKI
jgi:hypothetical protein